MPKKLNKSHWDKKRWFFKREKPPEPVDLSKAKSQTINELREAFRLQKLEEKKWN